MSKESEGVVSDDKIFEVFDLFAITHFPSSFQIKNEILRVFVLFQEAKKQLYFDDT